MAKVYTLDSEALESEANSGRVMVDPGGNIAVYVTREREIVLFLPDPGLSFAGMSEEVLSYELRTAALRSGLVKFIPPGE